MRNPDSSGRLNPAMAAFLRQEFASPATAMVGHIDLLLEDARSEGLDSALLDLGRMRSAAEQLVALISEAVAGADGAGVGRDARQLRHDLRTPLSAIKGYGELLVEEARERAAGTLLRDLGTVLDLAEQLLRDIDRLVGLHPEVDAAAGGASASSPAAIVRDLLRRLAPLEAAAAPPRHALFGRILVVDDDAANRNLLSRRLEREGHRIATAVNGATALERAQTGDFDLVLLDLMMPGLSGFEVLSRLKADRRHRDTPVIMISALDELDSTVRCIEAGAEDYLSKPVNPVLLQARVNASLEKKQLRDRERAIAEELRAEKERSEALLRNILPDTIIERLRQGERVIADRIAEATILFSDLVDFTAISGRLAPERTVALLAELFAEFDALVARFGLEKIKTIGDGYMVAGGLPQSRPDHASAVAEMALAMREVAALVAATQVETLELRIGIHSGPLVAGVIGTHKFVYDVWGDTVNTAKRIETNGAPGRIQVSAATRQLLGSGYRFEPRGLLEMKGKGLVETFFLERCS